MPALPTKKMPPTFPAKRIGPPVKFKSETETERTHRLGEERQATEPEKPLSNKEIALVLLVSHIEDSFLRLTDEQMAVAAGKVLRGTRPVKIREFYRNRVEKVCASMRKLLNKRKLSGRVTSFVGGAS